MFNLIGFFRLSFHRIRSFRVNHQVKKWNANGSNHSMLKIEDKLNDKFEKMFVDHLFDQIIRFFIFIFRKNVRLNILFYLVVLLLKLNHVLKCMHPMMMQIFKWQDRTVHILHLNQGLFKIKTRIIHFHISFLFFFSEPGANMRHIRKPNPKPIEI